MSDLDEVRAVYFEECDELLKQLEDHLPALDSGQATSEDVNAAFRAVHSIKGGAGMFSLPTLNRFAHKFESVLGKVRDGSLKLSAAQSGLLFGAGDVLAALVEAARGGGGAPPRLDEVTAQLDALAAGQAPTAASRPVAPPPPPPPPKAATRTTPATPTYRIDFVPAPESLRTGNDPLLVLREVARLGRVQVTIDLARLPPLDQLDPDVSHLAFTLLLQTDRPREDIEELFSFGDEPALLMIEEASAAEAEPAPAAAATPQVEAAPAPPASVPPPAAPAAAPPPIASPAPVAIDDGAAARKSVRVDLERLDQLLGTVGEIAVLRAVLAEQAPQLPASRYPTLIKAIDDLMGRTRELHGSVLALRAQPIAELFRKLPRLVREVAQKIGKNVRLVTEGEDTELDRALIELLSDPLTHLVRNAIDHGIETPEGRRAANKPEAATLRVAAVQRNGRVAIEVSDDGAGINRQKVRQRAVDRGLIAADAPLGDAEIDNLIFLPGFSTAEQVTELSGRGVGMDVVRANIRQMKGQVTLRSTPGQGTRVILSLPLTLAILDGMLMRVGRQVFVVPVAQIVESLRVRTGGETGGLQAGGGEPLPAIGETIAWRGSLIPLVPLGRLFGVADAGAPSGRAIATVVELGDGGRLALLIDELLDQRQVVLKNLDRHIGPTEGLSAATLLGDGAVGLILDTDQIKVMAERRRLSLGPQAAE